MNTWGQSLSLIIFFFFFFGGGGTCWQMCALVALCVEKTLVGDQQIPLTIGQ